MGIAREHSPPGAQQYNGVAESAIQRCNKVGMASRRSALRRLGPEGLSCIKGMDPRGDRLWAESVKDAVQKLNQSASPSNPGRASPQEVFTNKKGPFRVLPFLLEGFMNVVPHNKLADRAVRVFFLNGGDNHASCTVEVITRQREGRATRTAWCGRRRRPGGGASWCCFPSCDCRSARATEHLFQCRAAIAAHPCRYSRYTGRCPFIAAAVAHGRACRYCRSTARCLYIAAAATKCIAASWVCDTAACNVIECRRDAAAWNHSRRIAGLF